MTREDGNAYINFVLYAVLGKMGEADEMMRSMSDRILRAAKEFAVRAPVARVPIYRGMLLDPDQPVSACPLRTFVSWSEDIDVACWFASTDSVISKPLAASNPRLRGVVVDLPSPRRLVFHHSWARGWDKLARIHPHMGDEGARQIAWSLRTQREVITMPIALPMPAPVETKRSRSTVELDGAFAPPWISQ